MHSFTVLTAVVGLVPLISAHMEMSFPPPLRSKFNPNVPSGSVDYNMVAPLSGDGSNFPCKSYLSDIGSASGKSVVNWAAGGSYNFTIVGGASHGGGSCQASLSYDQGKSFTVIHSYMGNCPTAGSFKFTMPSDAPSGDALFAWTWYNKIGNREIYMNCASVTVGGSSTAKRASTSFSSRPGMFLANLGNGCTTIETTELTFPNPGPDVDNVSTTPGGVTGTCQPVKGISPGSSGSSGSSPSASPSAQSSSSVSALPNSVSSATSSPPAASGGVFQTLASSSTAAAPTAASTSSGSLSLSPDGSCGGTFGCSGSPFGSCCSQYGYCGKTDAYCGTGCQSTFGTCGSSSTNSSTSESLKVSTDKTCGGGTTNTCQGSSYGNCCSQYGYCGGTNDYCGVGCQTGFGSCGLSSSLVYTSSTSSSSTIVQPAASSGFIGVTVATAATSSGFITSKRTTSSEVIGSTATVSVASAIETPTPSVSAGTYRIRR